MTDSEPPVSATAERIRDFLAEDLQWQGSRSELTDDLPLIENQVVDSMSLLRLVSWLEPTFGITLPDEEIVPANFGTIAKIAALVESKQA
jgi:acyl carrier protein